jgi:hypothetical protein
VGAVSRPGYGRVMELLTVLIVIGIIVGIIWIVKALR